MHTGAFTRAARRWGMATARASNVYCGGDLHYDRLIRILIRAALAGQPAQLRAVRPRCARGSIFPICCGDI